MKFAILVTCAPGLIPFLTREVSEIEPNAKTTPSGVELEGSLETVHRLLLELGVATRVLLRIASFYPRSYDALEAHVARLPWSGWLTPNVPRKLRIDVQRSRLNHTGAIEERMVRAIASRLGDQGERSTADSSKKVTLSVRMFEDRCSIWLDAAGEPLHRRGYRLDPHRAPLREDLARALLVSSGWDRRSALLDPMCGSGTIAIEAARWAAGIAPGSGRTFELESTPLAEGLDELRERLRMQRTQSSVPILARDRDPQAVEAARENASRAGVKDMLRLEVGSLSEATLPAGDMRGASPAIVTNPPWGTRLGDRGELQRLYRALGALSMRSGASLTLAAHERALAYATGRPMESAFLTDLGGLKVSAMRSRESSTTQTERALPSE